MLSRTHVSAGCLAEYEAFAALIEGLNDKEWNATTRCVGWQARDVAGHVIGLAEDTAAGVPGSRNAEEEAASVRHESPAKALAQAQREMRRKTRWRHSYYWASFGVYGMGSWR